MGMSTDAILFYGIAYTEEEFDTDAIAQLHGIDTDDPDYYFDQDELFIKASGLEGEDYKVTRKAEKESMCEIGQHCSSTYPMRYVCYSPSHSMAHRGYVKDIQLIQSEAVWDEKIKSYCDLMKIPYRQPGWHLASYLS